MTLTDFDIQFARTMSIVRQLAKGKTLTVGYEIGMGEDMAIGWVFRGTDRTTISGDLTLKDLNELCEKYGIGMAIPDE